MTKPTPEQMLKLAQIVEPDKNWQIIEWKGELQICEDYVDKRGSHHIGKQFLPRRYRAQLMQVTILLIRKGHLSIDKCGATYDALFVDDKDDLWCVSGDNHEQAIINLAIEVLL